MGESIPGTGGKFILCGLSLTRGNVSTRLQKEDHINNMASTEKSKRTHSPDHEEEDNDSFVGPMPVPQKAKKKRG